MYDEQLYMCMFLLQCILLQHYVLPFYFLYMFMRLLVCLVNAMDRVLLAGRRHGDVTVNGIRASELQQWASMGQEEPLIEVAFHFAQLNQWKTVKMKNFVEMLNSRKVS